MRISSFSFGLPLILLLAVVGAQAEDCSDVSHSCNAASYPPNSPLQYALAATTTDLEQNTYLLGSQEGTIVVYYDITSTSDNGVTLAYGQGVCDISHTNARGCTICLTSLANCISSACGPTVGAWAQASDQRCFMRYEAYKFY